MFTHIHFENFVDPDKIFCGTLALQHGEIYWRLRVAVWPLDVIPGQSWLLLSNHTASVTSHNIPIRIAWPRLAQAIRERLLFNQYVLPGRLSDQASEHLRLFEVLKQHIEILSREHACKPFVSFAEDEFCANCNGNGWEYAATRACE